MPELQPGQPFGRYTIINQLAADDVATTYKAYDSANARDVLLKIVAPSIEQSADFSARFHDAMLGLMHLSHPNLLAVYDAGEQDGAHYVVSQAVEAATLAERMASGQVASSDIPRIITQVADALRYAHAQGVTHGALDPSSILIDARGNALLTNLGLAGLRAPSNAQADVTALAALALVLLTGKAALSDDTPLADALKPLTDTLPSSVQVTAGAAYERALRKALSPNASERFASVADFMAAWQQAQPAPARPQPPTPTAPTTPAPRPTAIPTAPTKAPPTRPDIAAQLEAARRAELETRAKALEAQAAEAKARLQREADAATARAQAAALRVTPTPSAAGRTVIRETIDPQKREALRHLMHVVRQVAAKRARGEVSVAMQRGAVINLARTIEATAAQQARAAQPALRHAGAEAASRAKVTATRDAVAAREVVQRHAVAGAQQVGKRTRPLIVTIFIWLVVLCVGLPILCSVILAVIPDAAPTRTPTPTRTSTPSRTPTATRTPLAPTIPSGAGRTAVAPSATSRAAATPTSALPLVTTVIFTDTFPSGTCRLPEANDERRALKCDNGEYTVLNKRGDTVWVNYDRAYGDVVIEVDARPISTTATMEYGVIWRVSPQSDAFYGLTLKPDGQIGVLLYENGSADYFIAGLTFSAVNTSGSNRLKVTLEKDHIALAVNDRVLPFSFNDSALTSGAVGFIVKSDEPNA
ncbi:MAG: protein kinase, partial [Chloroflexota bacterium]